MRPWIMVRALRTWFIQRLCPQQLLQNYPSGRFGCVTRPRPAEETLDTPLRQLLTAASRRKKQSERRSLLTRPPGPLCDPVARGTKLNWTELTDSITGSNSKRQRSWRELWHFVSIEILRLEQKPCAGIDLPILEEFQISQQISKQETRMQYS